MILSWNKGGKLKEDLQSVSIISQTCYKVVINKHRCEGDAVKKTAHILICSSDVRRVCLKLKCNQRVYLIQQHTQQDSPDKCRPLTFTWSSVQTVSSFNICELWLMDTLTSQRILTIFIRNTHRDCIYSRSLMIVELVRKV